MRKCENLKIAVAGTGYVGLSMAVLLSQHHDVAAVDIVEYKAKELNSKVSPKLIWWLLPKPVGIPMQYELITLRL